MRFEIYKDEANPSEWRWRLRAKNKKTIANSGELLRVGCQVTDEHGA